MVGLVVVFVYWVGWYVEWVVGVFDGWLVRSLFGLYGVFVSALDGVFVGWVGWCFR